MQRSLTEPSSSTPRRRRGNTAPGWVGLWVRLWVGSWAALFLAAGLASFSGPLLAQAPAKGELTIAEVEAAEAVKKAAAQAAAKAAAQAPALPPSLRPAVVAPAPGSAPAAVAPKGAAAGASAAAAPAAAASRPPAAADLAASAASAQGVPAASTPPQPVATGAATTATTAAAYKTFVRLPTGPNGPARALAFVGNRPLLAMASDNQLQLWDWQRQLNLGSLGGHDEVVTSVAASPNGQQLASVSADGQLRLWSSSGGQTGDAASTGVPLANALAYSADGRLLAVGGLQNTAVFNLVTGQGLFLLPGTVSGALQFSADGQWLAARGPGTWRLWSMDKGQATGSLATDAHGVPLALSPNFMQALRSDGRHVSLVNVADGSVVARTASAGVTQALFSPDGQHVAWVQGDGRALRWQLQGGVPQLLAPAVAPAGVEAAAPALAFSADGRLLAAAGADERLRLWDTQGQPQASLHASGQALHSLAFSPDGSALALALADGSAALLDSASGQAQALRARTGGPAASEAQARDAAGPDIYTPGRRVAFSADGRSLATAGGGQLRLFNRATGQLQVTLGAAQALDLLFSRDGAWLFVLEDKQLQVWDVATRYKLQTLPLGADLQHNLALAFDASGQQLLLWADGGEPRRVQLEARPITHQGLGAAQRRPAPGLPATLPPEAGWAARVSPDGKLLALDNGEGELLVLELDGGRELLRLRDTVPVNSTLQFSPDSRVLMAWGAGVNTHEVLRWSLPGGQALPALKGHRSRVLSVAATADGRSLASLAQDRTLRLWDAADGRFKAKFMLVGAAGGWVAVDHSGGFDAASPEAEAALLLSTGPGLADSGPLGTERSVHQRPGLLKRALAVTP